MKVRSLFSLVNINKHKHLLISVVGVALFMIILITVLQLTIFREEKVRNVTVILKSEKTSEFWSEIVSGIERAGDESGVDYKFVSSLDENDVNGQLALIDDVLKKKPDGIILAATDYYKIDVATQEIMDAHINLVLLDSGVLGSSYDSIVATDNYKAGYEGAKLLMGYLEAPKHIVLINHVQSSLTAMEREEGARDALKQLYKDATVEIFYCNDDPDAAYDYISRLHRYGIEIDGIIGLNERSTVGAARFVDDYIEELNVPIVGFDSSVEEIELLEKGIVKSLVIQQPFNMGYTAMTSLIKSMDHKKMPKEIDTGSIIITKENMYDPENQVILFPFTQ